MSREKRLRTAALLLLAVAGSSACRSPDNYTPRTKLPTIDEKPAATESSRLPPREPDALEECLDQVSQQLGQQLGPETSIGCLPLLSHWPHRREKSGVRQLGVWIAEQLADRLQTTSAAWAVASPTAMEGLLWAGNLPKATISTQSVLLKQADRLGVDVALFGSITEVDETRFAGPEAGGFLEVHLKVTDVRTAALLQDHRVEIRSDLLENTRYFRMARSPSEWQTDRAWTPATAQPTFDREIETACRVVARRLLPVLRQYGAEGEVLVPPADTGRFIRSVARLRAAQQSYAEEVRRRQEERDAGREVDADLPLTLGGVEFDRLQAAEDYLNRLRHSLQSDSTGFAFADSLSAMLMDQFQTQESSAPLQFHAWGPASTADVHVLEGEVFVGRGLPGATWEILAGRGVALLVAPRLESLGPSFLLRCDVYQVSNRALAASTFFRIDQRFREQMRFELGVRGYGLEPIDDLETRETGSWSQVYEEVASGVVRLQSPGGHGTGFLVSPEGHIMTNAHVVNALADSSSHALLADGSSRPFEVLLNNEAWDIAVVKVDGVPATAHVFEFANHSAVAVGSEVAVLGNPKGTSGWVLTPGHLSSLNEQVTSEHGQRTSYMYTCPTRGGSSGSPVLLLNGRVAGVHAAGQVGALEGGVSGTELTGFALGVPGHQAAKLLLASNKGIKR